MRLAPPARVAISGTRAVWEDFQALGDSRLCADASFCDLGPSFIAKGKLGDHFQAISRNGLVLLMSPAPVQEIAGRTLRLRISIWRKVILGDETPTPYGVILSTRTLRAEGTSYAETRLLWSTSIDALHLADAALSIELGGQRILNFLRSSNPHSR
jgi:hypothetical protein